MKQIQWFPGHMSKALREIGERVKVVDIVIEVVDARAPISSRNPELDKLIGNKQHLILLNKKDLANEQITKNWINYFIWYLSFNVYFYYFVCRTFIDSYGY